MSLYYDKFTSMLCVFVLHLCIYGMWIIYNTNFTPNFDYISYIAYTRSIISYNIWNKRALRVPSPSSAAATTITSSYYTIGPNRKCTHAASDHRVRDVRLTMMDANPRPSGSIVRHVDGGAQCLNPIVKCETRLKLLQQQEHTNTHNGTHTYHIYNKNKACMKKKKSQKKLLFAGIRAYLDGSRARDLVCAQSPFAFFFVKREKKHAHIRSIVYY